MTRTATVGGAAALMYLPASSSAATKPASASSPAPDPVTPAITTLTNQARQFNSEDGVAQFELARLKDQLTNEAATRYYRPSVAPVVSVQTSSSRHSSTIRRAAPSRVITFAAKPPATHTTTGASGAHTEKGDDSSRSANSSGAQEDN